MSSIIKGYNYDIFISYRQKDNKGDRWVSEFVEALKIELESTFKEEISVYFDINPHDGLLETHDVDASLKDKLKCLVFIPIISRTYCDPKSFAWEHEFKAFVEQASKDQFGLKVKLPNGNVASRVLPIKIHELDPEDKTLLENELGGVLRGIEFIYKEAGVNRPLTPNDNSNKNFNKTFYRDQINKVANAVKEIITSAKKQDQHLEETSKQDFEVNQAHQKNRRTKIIAGTIIALALIILGIFFIPKLFRPEEKLEKSIAVIPFRNLSNDPEQEYFSDGVVEAILNYLSKVGELKVISSTSTKRYRDTELSIKEIARELGVASILEGSVQKIGNNVRITVQLIEAKTDVHLWSEIYDKDISDIFAIQSEVAQNVAKELNATLTSVEKEQINKYQTENPEAYNSYSQGRFFIQKRTNEGFRKSVEYFNKAIAEDPNYALGYAGLADAYFLLAWNNQMPKTEAYTKSKEYANKALEIDKNLAEAHAVLGGVLTYYDWKWEEARKELKLAVKLNPKFVNAHSYYAELLDILRENKEAREHINIALSIDPFFPMMHILSGILYYHEGRFKESLDEYKKASELDPIGSQYWIWLGEDLKDTDALQEVLLRGDSLQSENAKIFKDIFANSGINGLREWLIESELKKSNPNPLSLAENYAKIGKKENALNWLEKASENPPSTFPRINNNPDFDNIRSEPRFKAILKKMGLSDYQVPN
jgi:TolB-like protein